MLGLMPELYNRRRTTMGTLCEGTPGCAHMVYTQDDMGTWCQQGHAGNMGKTLNDLKLYYNPKFKRTSLVTNEMVSVGSMDEDKLIDIYNIPPGYTKDMVIELLESEFKTLPNKDH
jgi:hypothetical protein